MPCYSPLKGFRTASGSVVFSELRRHGDITSSIDIPCGQCVGCRLERSRQWAMRCLHESELHLDNSFITLTYDDDHLPADWSLNYSHFQKFMKRLRKRFRGTRIRFYMCGEYGEQFGRPHYHACLFGFNFPDRVLAKDSDSGCRLYTSQILEDLWGFGFCTIGDVSFDSAAYVARYILKKVTGDAAEFHYTFVNPDTGEIYRREPEFCHMSLKPGIGFDWLQKYHKDVYPHDYVVVNGKQVKPPKYYDKKYGEVDLDRQDAVLADRAFEGYQRRDDATPDRLVVREAVTKGRLSFKKRSLT